MRTLTIPEPFKTLDPPAGPIVTRFISLAPLGNAQKQKSLHALALVPASEMDPQALAAQPEGTTASPYDVSRKRPMEDEAGLGEFLCYWDKNTEQ